MKVDRNCSEMFSNGCENSTWLLLTSISDISYLQKLTVMGWKSRYKYSLSLSLSIQGVTQLAITLVEEPEDHIQAAAAWALGQIGRHTPEHAKAVAVANVLPRLLQCYTRADASEDLQTKVDLSHMSLPIIDKNLVTQAAVVGNLDVEGRQYCLQICILRTNC